MNEEYLAVKREFLCNSKDYIAGILLAELQRRYDYSKIRGELAEDGYFKIDVKDLKAELGLTDYKFKLAKKKLQKEKYITCDVRDIPAKCYIKLNN